MNIATWVLAGGVMGWMGFVYLRFNAKRGLAISIIIGIAGGLLGGGLLAPLFGASLVNPGDFNPLSLFIAAANALGFLIVTDMVYQRFGI